MESRPVMDFDIVIGLEVHAQLNTQSKVFAPDSTAFGANPNTQVSYITLAHPGTLPFLNQKVAEFAVMLGLATNCQIREYNEFSRKNYFYADLPKGYQISQYDTPICYDGFLDITFPTDSTKKRIRINRIHIEEDAGKSIHDLEPEKSFIDLNRAGVPLLEIVSEPDLSSADEAYQYVSKIKQLVEYLGICDGNMEEGSLRCDVNISVRPKDQKELGQRVEVKNLNSLRNIKRAILFETQRQTKLISRGTMIARETRSFDANNGTTFPLRGKELEHDYRYFPEPDLPPLILTLDYIQEVRQKMPVLPEALYQHFTQTFGLSDYDAAKLTEDRETAMFFMQIAKHLTNYKAAANWMMGPVKSFLNASNLTISDFTLPPEKMAELISLTQSGKVSFSVAAQELFPEFLKNNQITAESLAKQMGLMVQVSNDEEIEALVSQVLQQFPDKVKEYQKGKKGLSGFFIGQVSRLSKTKLDPQQVGRVLTRKLDSGT